MPWPHMGLPTEVTLQQALHTNVVKETKLLHCPQDIIYTDGSKRGMNEFGTVTGSGVYRPCQLPLQHYNSRCTQ